MNHYSGVVVEQLNRVFHQGTLAGLTEGQLLDRFVEGDESAFAALVARHGPMVHGVCRRILRDEHAAEDAFQATFLVLVRRAAAIRDGNLIGPWLHGVAHRVAMRARARTAYRNVRETTGLEAVQEGAGGAFVDQRQHDLRAILDEELARLPGVLRSPVVLCYLEGLTHDEAARRLRWPVGTVRSRMARARDLLQRRLARRGIMADGCGVAAALARQPVPVTLIDSTVRASLTFATKQTTAAGMASATATALARGVLQTMMISRFKLLGTAALAGAVALGGAQTLARQFGVTGGGPQPPIHLPKPNDGTTALLRSVDKIDGLLDDLERRNRDFQTEVRALQNEIVALRSAVPKAARPIDQARPSAERGAELPIKAPQIAATPHGPIAPKTDRPIMRSLDEPSYAGDQLHLVVISPEGDKVAVYNRYSGKTKAIQLPDPKPTRNQVQAAWGEQMIALTIKGPKLSRIAVFAFANTTNYVGRWFPQDLREQVDSALPAMGNGTVYYDLGRYVYAFSRETARWSVLELSENRRPQFPFDANSRVVRDGDRLHVFNLTTGVWDEINIRTIEDSPDERPRTPGTQ